MVGLAELNARLAAAQKLAAERSDIELRPILEGVLVVGTEPDGCTVEQVVHWPSIVSESDNAIVHAIREVSMALDAPRR
jgi:hypothetical protein